MSTIINIDLPRLHVSQQMVKDSTKRFNVLACGRRWGKTVLLQDWLLAPALMGYPVAWFAPAYKYLLDAWQNLSAIFRSLITRYSVQERRIELRTNGLIEFWTLDDLNAGRSRKYKRVVIDEASLTKDLLLSWETAIRPTLADYRGDAMFAGTPKGRDGFWSLWQRGQADLEWAAWRFPTDSNPFIAPEEVMAMRASLPATVVAQEIDAEFVDGPLTLFNAEDIAAAVQPYERPAKGRFLTTVDVGRRRDATIINTFETTQQPYRRVWFERLERVPYPYITQRLESVARQFPGRMVIESNGVGDPLIEATNVAIEPFVTTARSKLQALQGLQLLFEQREIFAEWDSRERQALLDARWDDDHTADEVMSLAIFAASVGNPMDKVITAYRQRRESREAA